MFSGPTLDDSLAGMEAGLLTNEDLPVLVAREMFRQLGDKPNVAISIDLLAPTDSDGWCVGAMNESGGVLKLAAPEDLAENEFLSCEGLHASIVAYSWSARQRAALESVFNFAGAAVGDSQQIDHVSVMLGLAQRLDQNGIVTTGGIVATNSEQAVVSGGYIYGDWLPDMGATATYDGPINQTVFVDWQSGASAYLGTTARWSANDNSQLQTPYIAETTMFASSDDWNAFDVEAFAASPDELPRQVFAMSEYAEGQWAIENAEGFQVLLRDRYISNEATSEVISFVQSSAVPPRFLPNDMRQIIDALGGKR